MNKRECDTLNVIRVQNLDLTDEGSSGCFRTREISYLLNYSRRNLFEDYYVDEGLVNPDKTLLFMYSEHRDVWWMRYCKGRDVFYANLTTDATGSDLRVLKLDSVEDNRISTNEVFTLRFNPLSVNPINSRVSRWINRKASQHLGTPKKFCCPFIPIQLFVNVSTNQRVWVQILEQKGKDLVIWDFDTERVTYELSLSNR